MVLVTIFTISGVSILTLTTAKRVELKRGKTPGILNLVAKGDTYLRNLNHRIFEYYFGGKDGLDFFFTKWIPVQTKLSFNKALNRLRGQLDEYIHDMRDAKLLKKSDGISEFFKNISDIEKGQGEINEAFIIDRATEPTIESVEDTAPLEPQITEIIEPVGTKATKPKRKRKIKVKEDQEVL